MAKHGMRCVECGRPVVLIKPGKKRQVYRSMSDHDLCKRCWRSLRDQNHVISAYRKNKNG